MATIKVKEVCYVVMTHSFDAETYIWEFDNYDKAKAFLHWEWERYYNEEIACDSCLLEAECFHEDEYARVTWDDGDFTEFNLFYGLDKIPEEFEKEWKRYV